MKRPMVLAHKFVISIPNVLNERTHHVSVDYATVVYKFCCGCRRKVVTPLTPTNWTLIYEGVSILLDPSIGNGSFKCRSHYWMSRSTVRWARQWPGSKIAAGRAQNRRLKQRYYGESEVDLRRTEKHPRETDQVALDVAFPFFAETNVSRLLGANSR